MPETGSPANVRSGPKHPPFASSALLAQPGRSNTGTSMMVSTGSRPRSPTKLAKGPKLQVSGKGFSRTLRAPFQPAVPPIRLEQESPKNPASSSSIVDQAMACLSESGRDFASSSAVQRPAVEIHPLVSVAGHEFPTLAHAKTAVHAHAQLEHYQPPPSSTTPLTDAIPVGQNGKTEHISLDEGEAETAGVDTGTGKRVKINPDVRHHKFYPWLQADCVCRSLPLRWLNLSTT